MAMQTGGGTARDRIMARARALDDEEKKKQQAQQPQQTRQSARAQVPMRYRQTAQEPGQEAAQQPHTTARDRIQARARAMGRQRVMSGLGDLTVEEYQYALKQAEAASPKRDENPGFFSRVGKWLVGKTEKTPEEIVAEQWDALEAARKREELASLDLDEYEKLLEQAKKQAADARPDFNIHAMGAYDAAAENTQAQRKADEMQQTYNLAKQVQFERQGEQALAQLTPKQLEAVETLAQTPATGTSVMSAGVARENARDQAYSVLLEGGYSYKTISDLVTWRSRQQDKEAYQKTVQWHEDLADSGVLGGAAATVLSVPENLLSGVGAIDVALQKANQTGGEERPVNYYSAPMRLYGGANAARETVGQKLERNTDATIFGQNVASTAYGIGTSMLDSGATVALAAIGVPPVVGSSLLGGAAATGAMVDAKDRGVDDTHALWTGVFAGVAETMFEDVSLERLLKLDVPQGTLRQRMQTTLKNTLLQAGTEGSEELFTDFANYITDRAINGGLSEYDTAVRAYMDQGLSQKEASQKAGADLAAQMALDFVAGGVAGGLMAGGKAAIDNAGQNREMRQYSDLAPAAAEERLAADPGSQAARRVQKQVRQGKPVSGAALRETMAQNVEAQNQAVTEQVRKLAQQRLEELGDTQAEKTSRAVAQLYDQELPWYRRELARKALRSSEYGQRVANEMEDAVETGRVRTLLEQAGETEDAARVPRWTSGEWAENLPRYTSQGAYINQLMERRVNPAATDKRPVTGFRYNQETGQLDAIVKGEDGKVETIPKEKAATTDRQEWLADLAADLKEAAPTMIASYMDGQDVQTFSRQWHNAYEYGAAGVKKDYAMNSQAVDQLNATQRELAYDAGAAARAVQQAQERMKFPQEGQDTGMTREGTVSLKGATVGGVTYAPVTQETMTRRQRDSVEVMRQLARVSGVDVVFYQSRANGQGRYTEANGFYRDGTVYLDINAGKNAVGDLSETAVLLTAAHELTHFIQEYSPAQYEQLRDFVVERLTESQDTDLDTLMERHRRAQPGLSYDQALDEVVADGCQMMLQDSQAAAQLARKNRSLAGNIRSWLRKWVKRLQEAMRGLTARSREAKAMEQYAGELQKIWDNALVRAAENRQRAQSGQETGAAAQTRTEGQYEIRYPTYTDEQMEKNAAGLRTMKAVAKVTGDELGPRSISIKERVTKYFASLGNNVHTEAFGDVALSNSSVHSEIRHGHTSAKVATYAAIPEVLRSGVVIYRKEKNRHGLERIVVAAPVEVGTNAEKMYVGVMLQRDPQTQRLYLHDAVTEKEPAAQTDGHLSTTGPNGMESELYTTSILHRALQVKKKTEPKPAGALHKNKRSSIRRTLHADVRDNAESVDPNAQPSTDSIRSSVGNSQENFSVRDDAEDVKTVEKYFGTTYNVNEAGYILIDGKLLDMSGRHEGAPGGYRTVDHRDIADAFDGEYGDGSYSGGMIQFMRAGNIRLSPESGGINLSVKPNKAQLATLDRYISKYRGEVMVDFDNEAGDTVASAAYRSRTYSKRVLDDINAYFDNGTVPTGNADTLFSVREAGITDRELLANALETTARNDLERGLLAQYQEKAKSAAQWERWLDYHQQKLADHESGVHPLTTQQVLLAREKAAQYAEMLDQLDEKLLKIESMGPMRKLLGRERSYVDDLLTGAVAAEKEHFQAEFEQRLQDARRREQESLVQYRERREESERRRAVTAKIERTTRQLADRLNTNTDKKHIPEPLKKPVAQMLTALDYSSRSSLRGDRATRADQEYCRAMEGIRRVLADQEAFQQGTEGSEDALGGYLDLPPGLTDLMTKHIQTVENIIEDRMPTETVLRRMNLTQLRDLDVILSTVTRAVTKMNELLENRTFIRVADAAEDTMAELHRRGQHKGAAEKAETFVAWDNALPWYAFQRFGEGGRAIFEELQDGWDKLAFNSKQVLDFRQGVITDEQARAWDTEVRRVELLDQEGETVTVSMTTAQLMSLYCLSKRKQALGHLFGGGIRITDIETRGKLRKKTIKQDEHYKMDGQMLGRLLGQLTPEQIAVADKLQKYMTEQGSKWGNEVTMKRFGYRGFTEGIYYPIETDSQDRLSRAGDGTEGSLYRLQNISAVKPLVQNANNAIMLRGIFDVFSNHMADMAKYNALVIPIVDAQKWYNYKDSTKNETGQVNTRTVQRAMTKAYGQSANRYVVQFLKDLNGVKESGARGEQFAVKMISNYKRAAVAANLRVAVLQPTAYVRAAAVLDYKYLAAAFGSGGRATDAVKIPEGPVSKSVIERAWYALLKKTGTLQAMNEMLENSGIALWKDMGFFDTDVGRSVRDQIKGKGSKLEKLVDKSMLAAEWGDKLTWARLWRACKLEVQEKQKLSGQALLEGTARRFREVIYQTQVVDSTMTRSDIMRSSSTFSKMFTSFMSEPTVSYNLIMEGTRQILKDKKAMGLKTAIGRNWKTVGWAYQAYVVSALAAAVVESLADALRDTDDDPLWEKLLDAFGGWDGNLVSDLNPLNKLPVLREVFNAIDGRDNGRMDTEVWAAFKKAYDILMESYRLATGKQEKATATTYYGNMTTYGKVYQTFRAVSMLSGLPISATSRELVTVWNNTAGFVWPGLKCRTYENKAEKRARAAYSAILSGDSDAWTEAYKKWEAELLKDGNSAREARSAIYGDLKKLVRNDYYEGVKTQAESEAIMQKYFEMNGDETRALVKRWECYYTEGVKYEDMRSAYETEQLNQAEVVRLRKTYGGETADEAYDKIRYWDFCIEYPQYDDISETKANKFYDYCEKAGIKAKRFYEAVCATADYESDKDAEGKTVSGSLKAKYVAYIQSMGLTPSQQKAMWLALKNSTWSDKDTPWE